MSLTGKLGHNRLRTELVANSLMKAGEELSRCPVETESRPGFAQAQNQ